jgi:hypothetical protein
MSVTKEARFITLGPEIGSRIQTRENVLLYYMLLSGSLLSAALSAGERGAFAIAIPYLALASSLLAMHHDLIIGVLSDFLKDLSLDTEGPRWHYNAEYLPRALKYRTIRDVGVAFFMIFSVSASLVISWPTLARHGFGSVLGWLWWGGALCEVGVVAVIVYSWGARNRRPFARWLWEA